jgi:hypothetical protein
MKAKSSKTKDKEPHTLHEEFLGSLEEGTSNDDNRGGSVSSLNVLRLRQTNKLSGVRERNEDTESFLFSKIGKTSPQNM